ncbi:ParB N-terminal domain-containing protein [Streptomyces sp. NPDC021093]|uniref:ParB N-terminal domain-containing protein n=1 Tax=Streptomyces sp. NPDC021093 TaxID=3365112 RepID=UPI003797B792
MTDQSLPFLAGSPEKPGGEAGRLRRAAGGGPDRQLVQMVPISTLLPSDSPRVAGEDARHVAVLARARTPLPPIIVQRSTMRVVDGMHRLRAAVLKGEDRIAVQFFDGDAEEAFVLAVSLNSARGLLLSQADRASAATRIVASHPQWSDRRIAAVTGISASSVAALRPRSTEQIEQLKKRVGRDGRARPVEPTEGRMRASRLVAAKPGSTLKEVAEKSGISIATAKDVRDRVRAGRDPLPPRLRSAEAQRERADTDRAFPERHRSVLPPRAPTELDLVLQAMLRDPSMRTEAGRTLLQMLRTHAIDESNWRRLAASVPGHRAATVARAARDCAEQWLRLARQVEAGRGGARGDGPG